MARSEILTWLSLDEWGGIMGVNPLSLNQLSSSSLFPDNDCTGTWFQNAFQHADHVGRDELAMAIQAAEQEISREVGYNLVPEWTIAERLPYPHPGQPGVYGTWGTNPGGMFKSVELLRGNIVSGGVKTKTLIQAGAAIVRSDLDVDNYQETCTVTVPVAFTDTNQVRAYYPAQGGSDGWEIRPIQVSISGGFATIIFKAWLVVAANQQNALNAQPLDALTANNYETSIDVYQVYNDPSTQVQFMWENGGPSCCGTCIACQFGTQAGCFHLRNPRLGFAVLAPGSWDSSSQTFTSAEWSNCREPDQVRLWYYSGNVDQSLGRPYVEMSPYWKYAVAFYAASKLDRPVYGCSNVMEYIEKWRLDASFGSIDKGGFTKTAEQMSNRLGTSMGALYAYQRIQQNGVRITK